VHRQCTSLKKKPFGTQLFAVILGSEFGGICLANFHEGQVGGGTCGCCVNCVSAIALDMVVMIARLLAAQDLVGGCRRLVLRAMCARRSWGVMSGPQDPQEIFHRDRAAQQPVQCRFAQERTNQPMQALHLGRRNTCTGVPVLPSQLHGDTPAVMQKVLA
jgi:hypothetical protein